MAGKNKVAKNLDAYLTPEILDGLTQAMLVIDQNYQILAGNDAVRKIFQLEDVFVGQNLFDLISFQKEAEVKKSLQDFFKNSPEAGTLEFNFYRPAGLFVRALCQPITGAAGRPARRLLLVMEDISPEKRQDLEISSRNDEIKKLILIAFHDIKASIVAIQGLLESFTHENELLFNERARFYLESINNRLHFTERLARDVVDFTRIGMYIFPTEKVHLNEIISTLEQELGQRLKEKNIRIKIMGELPIIYASRERFTRVFFNLIDNAIKYSRPDVASPEIVVGYFPRDNQLVFFVRDNGIGISSANQNNIFDLFERLPRAIQQHPDGTGIGLAIVKKIVEMYRGEVWVESEENKGAAFYFSLPSEMLY